MSPKKEETNGKKPSFQFSFLRPVKTSEIPDRIGKKRSYITSLEPWKEVIRVFEYIQKNGVAPFEEALMLTTDMFPEMDKHYKDSLQSLLITIRGTLKEYKLETKLGVQQRGNQLFIVAE